MSNTDENKPVGKSGQRNRKGEQRRQKSASPQSPAPEQLLNPELEQPESREPDPLRNPEPVQLQSPKPDQFQSPEPEAEEQIEAIAAPPEAEPIGATESAGTAPVSLRTIANAYSDYTRRSFEETRSYVERLKGARSLGNAMEVQSDFARHAYENFVADSQKIYELQKELARQMFKPLESLVAKRTRDPR
jgi:hypothetical protein